jgi:hypothetical protein
MPACDRTIGQPHDLEAETLSPTRVFLDWRAGQNNIWYCINLAKSRSDLLTGQNTKFNTHCWTTQTSAEVRGLDCGDEYWYSIYGWNNFANAVSDPEGFTMPNCPDTLEEAPIEEVDAYWVGGSDGHAEVQIEAALPNSCHSPASHREERDGNTINVTVLNNVVQADSCTMEFRTYDLTINLGSDFVPGEFYTVRANDQERDRFQAQ